MHELHKKSHKKEEKKKEMKEKKKENMDKKEEEAKKKGKKEAEKKKKHKNSSMEKKYKKEHDHEQEASALTMSSVDPDIDSGLPLTANATGGQSYQLRLPAFQRPASAMSASASTLRPQVMFMAPFGATKSSERPETLSRLMHVDHHDDHRKLPSFGLHEISPNNNNHNDTSSLMYHIEKAGEQNDSEIRRRSDDVTTVKSTSPSSTTTTTPKPSNLTTMTTTSSQPASNSTDSNPAKLANMDDKKQAKQQVQEGQIKLLTNLIKLAKARQEQPPAMVPPLKSEYHDKYQSLESPRTSLEANQPRLVFASPRQLMQEFNGPNLFELSNTNNINPSNYQASTLPEIGLPTNAIQLHQQQQQQNLPIFSRSPFAVNSNAPIGQAFLGDSNQFSQPQPLLDQFNINRFEFESDSPIMHAISPHQHQTIPSTAYQAAINNYLGVNWIKR